MKNKLNNITLNNEELELVAGGKNAKQNFYEFLWCLIPFGQLFKPKAYVGYDLNLVLGRRDSGLWIN